MNFFRNKFCQEEGGEKNGRRKTDWRSDPLL
jgi:hypothetical protein